LGKQNPVLDAQVFARTASLFAQKREALAPETLETLASDIVRRLARTIKQDPGSPVTLIAAGSVAAFCDILVKDDPVAALQFIDDRRVEGLTRQDLYLGYIAQAAERLGQLWDEDLLSFTEVAVATGQLYALMRALRDETAGIRPGLDARRRAFFATVPGEDHGIGITIAADLFRNAGWEIDLQIGLEHEDLMAHVEFAAPRVIGLSLSTEQRLGELMRLVIAMRIAAPLAIIGVAPGAGIDRRKLSNLVDTDLLFGDVPSALGELERLIRIPR